MLALAVAEGRTPINSDAVGLFCRIDDSGARLRPIWWLWETGNAIAADAPANKTGTNRRTS